jgi:hypothetical protein
MDANSKILADPYRSVAYAATTVNFKCGPTGLLQQFGAPPYNLTSNNQANQLMDQFLIAYSEHEFASDLGDKVLAFLATH